jgi:hypothetical protein
MMDIPTNESVTDSDGFYLETSPGNMAYRYNCERLEQLGYQNSGGVLNLPCPFCRQGLTTRATYRKAHKVAKVNHCDLCDAMWMEQFT